MAVQNFPRPEAIKNCRQSIAYPLHLRLPQFLLSLIEGQLGSTFFVSELAQCLLYLIHEYSAECSDSVVDLFWHHLKVSISLHM